MKSLSSFRSQHSYRGLSNNQQQQQHPMSSYHRGAIHCQQQQQSKFRPPSHQTSYHDLRFASRQQQLVSSPLDSQTTTDQFGFNQLPNHLPATQILDRSRIKCANHRCGTGSKVRSVSIFDNQKENYII